MSTTLKSEWEIGNIEELIAGGDKYAAKIPTGNMPEAKTVDLEPKITTLTLSGRSVQQLVYAQCKADSKTRLMLNGGPLVAKVLSYGIANVQWQAGQGWPVYHSRCPVDRFDNSMYVPNAKMHAILVEFGGTVWTECSQDAAHGGQIPSEVFVYVNDNNYKDNLGTFDVIVYGYSQ